MKKLDAIPSTSDITPESLYLRRREFLRNALLFTATSASVGTGLLWLMHGNRASERNAAGSPSALPVAESSA
jgi:sulfoxide reductase catalytic subunit YedY